MAIQPILVAEVYLWGTLVGYVAWDEKIEVAAFEYADSFLKAPIEPAPIMMLKSHKIFSFRNLNKDSFKGLPGFLADSLPDKFGNTLIDAWLTKQGRSLNSFNPVERLCYIGTRSMGALEFQPCVFQPNSNDMAIDIDQMVVLASEILQNKFNFRDKLNFDDDNKMEDALRNLLLIGTSAGGARAKCIIAIHKKTGEIRSGQVKLSDDYEYWLLKLDGIAENKDKETNDPKGYGRLEYAYSLMAKDCQIEMTECRMLEENGRAHFMTKRFDRLANGEKLHMQSLCAIAHFDFHLARAYSYEQAMEVIRRTIQTNSSLALIQQFRRVVFNVVGRNQDDHTKNISFLMNKQGQWQLSPAYDLTYSYNPNGQWTNSHQMSINGKCDKITRSDLLTLAKFADITNQKANSIINETIAIFDNWTQYARIAGIPKAKQNKISQTFRLDI